MFSNENCRAEGKWAIQVRRLVTHTLAREPEIRNANTSMRKRRGRKERAAEKLLGCVAELSRMGKWASTGCSRATHKQRVAANTGSGAAEADR